MFYKKKKKQTHNYLLIYIKKKKAQISPWNRIKILFLRRDFKPADKIVLMRIHPDLTL